MGYRALIIKYQLNIILNKFMEFNKTIDNILEKLYEGFVSGVYGDGDKKHSIDRLVKLVSKRKPVELSINKVIRKNKSLGTAEGNFLENIKKPNKKFYERAMRANIQYPIMLSEEGWIIDGAHRVSKLKWMGKDTIKVHIISKADLEKTKITNPEELKKSEKIRH
jgi:hypothetical protein